MTVFAALLIGAQTFRPASANEPIRLEIPTEAIQPNNEPEKTDVAPEAQPEAPVATPIAEPQPVAAPKPRTPDPSTRAARSKPYVEPPPPALPAREKAVIDAHPQHDLIVCVAGCGAGPARIIWKRPKLAADAVGSYVGLATAASTGSADTSNSDDIICIAGCRGPAGTVLWRGLRVAWLGDTSREQLVAALREVHEQLKVDAPPVDTGRKWMTTNARQHLDAALANHQ